MEIRKAKAKDLKAIYAILDNAKKIMDKDGNKNQWKDLNKVKEIVLKDVNNENFYLVEDNNKIYGVFSFIIGDDPTYSYIKGKWLNNDEYGTIHKIASSGEGKNIFSHIFKYCKSKIKNIKIDTHKDNARMKHLIEKTGFHFCGEIYLSDGDARLAYQYSERHH